jgi:hypothetical protein
LPISFSKNGGKKKHWNFSLEVPTYLPNYVCLQAFLLFLYCEDVSLRRAFVFLSPSSLKLLSLGALANALASIAIVSQSIRFQEKEVDKVETPQQRPAAVAIHHYSLCCFFL